MISLIVCMSNNRVIGKDNHLPWNIPEDMKHFINKTAGRCVVMGYNTWLSIKKPLPGRRNVVMTKSIIQEVECYDSVEEVMKNCKDFFVIGGEQTYKQFLPYVDYIYLTVIPKSYDGDTFMPEFENDFIWTKKEEIDGLVFREYKRKSCN